MTRSAVSTKRFYLIHKRGEYRQTGYITDTELSNHERHDWQIVKSWATEPTRRAVQEAAEIHSFSCP